VSPPAHPSSPPQPNSTNGKEIADVDSRNRPRLTRIFISYKREELPYADTLHRFLQRAGYDVWWDRELQTGGAWESELDRQVILAGCVIVLWSERSAASSWVRHEASAAMGRDKYLPVTIEKVDVPDPFGRIHAADLVGWDGSPDHPGFRALLDSLERKLDRRALPYELTTRERLPPWPARIPRHPVQRVAYWFRRNSATLIATAALATLAFTVLATEASVRRLDAQVTKVTGALEATSNDLQRQKNAFQASLRRLDAQIMAVEDALAVTGADLGWQLHASQIQQDAMAQQQKGIARQLTAQAEANKTTTTNLSSMAGIIKDNAKAMESLRDDSLKRVDAFEVQVVVNLDPLELKKSDGQALLPADLIETLMAAREGTQRLSADQFVPIVDALSDRLEDVREAFFKGWDLDVLLQRSAEPTTAAIGPSISRRFQRDDGLRSFAIAHVPEDGTETPTVQCTLVYRIPTHAAVGLRTYEDFRGANLTLELRAAPRLLKLTTVHFSLANYPRDLRSTSKDDLSQPSDAPSKWLATLRIPSNYLSHLSTSQPEIPVAPGPTPPP
jgi:hypothetical protein